MKKGRNSCPFFIVSKSGAQKSLELLTFLNDFEIQKTKKLINPVLFLLFASISTTSEPRPGGGSKLRNGETSKKSKSLLYPLFDFEDFGARRTGSILRRPWEAMLWPMEMQKS